MGSQKNKRTQFIYIHFIQKQTSLNMDHLKASFERELKNKLSEKTRGAQSEAQVLMKAFKYFDLNDNGVVEPDEFAKAIEKIGIQIPTRQVSHKILSSLYHYKHTIYLSRYSTCFDYLETYSLQYKDIHLPYVLS